MTGDSWWLWESALIITINESYLSGELIAINMNEGVSTKYTMNMTVDMNHSLEQIKVLLRKFQEDNLVLDEPVNTIIIAMYCILVTI